MRPPDSSEGGARHRYRPTAADAAAAKPHEVRPHGATPLTIARAAVPWHRLVVVEREQARLRRVRQLQRSLQARRDAWDRAGAALAAAWLAEAQGAA